MRNGVTFLEEEFSRNLLEQHCQEIGVDLITVEQLIQEEIDVLGLERRDRILLRIHEIVRDSIDWSGDSVEKEDVDVD